MYTRMHTESQLAVFFATGIVFIRITRLTLSSDQLNLASAYFTPPWSACQSVHASVRHSVRSNEKMCVRVTWFNSHFRGVEQQLFASQLIFLPLVASHWNRGKIHSCGLFHIKVWTLRVDYCLSSRLKQHIMILFLSAYCGCALSPSLDCGTPRIALGTNWQ